MSNLTNIQVGNFLRNFEANSTFEIIEGAKEKNEIIKIAKAKGIDLKKNQDISGFKCVYAWADRKNANNDFLPEKALLKALPTIIGKPVNLRHDRRYVVGHILDYRYQQNTKKVIAFGIVYKSCFGEEWNTLKKDFADKKLTVSFEIFSPENKRKIREDGVTELYEMTMAGMALLPRDVDPAFEGANVLALARKKMETSKDLSLVYASKYKDSDIITADIYLDEIEKNLKKLQEEEDIKKEEEQVIKLTKRAEPKIEEKEETPKVEVTEPKEVIEEIKEEEIVKEAPKEPEVIANPKITCSNCKEEFEVIAGQIDYKCPKCFAILDTKGEMKYPPQIKDFRLSCPSCSYSNWLILSNEENKTVLKCQNEICNKQYEIEFAQEVKNELLEKTNFLYTNTVSCIQCGNMIDISGVSKTNAHEVKCPKCKLVFEFNRIKANKDRQITKITEVIVDDSEKGGDEDVKIPKEIVEKVKEEEKKEEVEDKPKEEVKEAPKEEIKEEEKQVEKVEENKAEKPGAKASIEISESSEEVTEAARGKGKGRNGKPQGDGGADKCVCSKCGYEASHEKGIPCNEKKCPKCGIALVGKNKEAKKKKIKPKKSAVRRAVRKIMDLKKEVKTAKSEKKEKENTFKTAIKKVASQLIKANAEIKKIKKEADEKIKFIEENEKTILKRREELGEKFAKDLSDKDILNEDKFKTASLEKEVTLLKASKEVTDDIVGDKTDEDENFEVKKLSEEIDKKAFTK